MRTFGDALSKRIRLRPGDRVQVDRLAQVIEATPDFVITIDVKGYVLYCNPAVRKMLGMSGEDDAAKLHLTEIYSARSCATVLGEGVLLAILDGAWSGEAALLVPDERSRYPK